ncbi:MAG: tetratricopeptide repeat protein, partial [Elusimicrobiaceae bacterium]|nr:tetratricopeptide repeat protein [Elusimicrobiaceae bacterium]
MKKTILLFLSIALFLPNLSYAQQEEKTSIRSSVRTNRAYDFYQQGEYQKATKNLDEALRIDPKNEKTRKLK